MPFQKGNKLGANRQSDRPLDKDPLCFATYEGQKRNLREKVPGWQQILRDFVDSLLNDAENNKKEEDQD